MDLTGKSVLITGGTGSFGKKLVEVLLRDHAPRRVIIYSRDELKQSEMAADPRFSGARALRYFIGDVRDRARLCRAFDGVDVVVHAAAMKQVPAAEYNPFEAVKTNVLGAQNVIDSAIDKGVQRVVALSTDKAASPVNLYGATKLCSDKLFIHGNTYAGERDVALSVVRYGNVVGSRGSVVPLFLRQRETGELTVTDDRMTRFWITLEHAARFVVESLSWMKGGELFVPKIPSMRITDLAEAIAPGVPVRTIGIRPGEKLHEVMITEDDARLTVELDDRFIILPSIGRVQANGWLKAGRSCPEGYRYGSDTNDWWLTPEELRRMVAGLDLQAAKRWAEEVGVEGSSLRLVPRAAAGSA